jgi:transcriptional regulator with XRE-family HTH domain
VARNKTESKRRGNGRDSHAGETIRRLRVYEGLSREEFVRRVSAKAVRAGFDRARVEFSPDLLELVESRGHEPGPRIKFAIAFYYGVRPGQIWKGDDFELPFELPPLTEARVAA